MAGGVLCLAGSALVAIGWKDIRMLAGAVLPKLRGR
jgi:hypothetical protein